MNMVYTHLKLGTLNRSCKSSLFGIYFSYGFCPLLSDMKSLMLFNNADMILNCMIFLKEYFIKVNIKEHFHYDNNNMF